MLPKDKVFGCYGDCREVGDGENYLLERYIPDASSMACLIDESEEVTEKDFRGAMAIIDRSLEKIIARSVFGYHIERGVLWAHDQKKDIHYFFV